jgi:hypothetical protein
VGAGQFLVIVASLINDVEFQTPQAGYWGTVGTSRERQKSSALLIIPLVQDDFPEPTHHGTVGRKAIRVMHCVFKIVEVQSLLTNDQTLELGRIKDCHKHFFLH